ncbi:MAG TPA: 50S ribosomal protein L9 [Ignavibacteria bacterium]|nr:50S ribosomal protein L9 [Ignavibacteria bacterium]
MKIILKKEHEILGDEGQIVNVKNGYARNYLIPKGYATIANDSNLKSFEEIKKQRAKKVQKLIDEANKIASDLSSHSITIAMKTGEDDRIFGSVTSQMIYDKLKEKGFEDIDRKKIILKEQIKSLGEHELEIKLQQSVVAKIKINVVKEILEEIRETVSEEPSSEQVISEPKE